MPFVDRIIQFLQANQGERIVIESDQPCVIYRPDGAGAPTENRLSFSQITTMLGEVMPDEHRAAFASGQHVMFPYASASGLVDVEITGATSQTSSLPATRSRARATASRASPVRPSHRASPAERVRSGAR